MKRKEILGQRYIINKDTEMRGKSEYRVLKKVMPYIHIQQNTY